MRGNKAQLSGYCSDLVHDLAFLRSRALAENWEMRFRLRDDGSRCNMDFGMFLVNRMIIIHGLPKERLLREAVVKAANLFFRGTVERVRQAHKNLGVQS